MERDDERGQALSRSFQVRQVTDYQASWVEKGRGEDGVFTLQLILDNWQYFTPKERERIAAYVAMNWRLSRDRRWVAETIRSPIDELFVRYFVRDEPNAQEELTQWLTRLRKK